MLRRLSQNHSLHIIRSTNRYMFAEVGAKKKVDKSKACIRLMMEWPETNLEIERLKQSHQYSRDHAIKGFNFKTHMLNLGDVVNLLIQGELIQLQIYGGFDKLVQVLLKSFNVSNSNLKELKLHQGQNINNFLVVVEHLQKHTSYIFIRALSALLCNYMENFEELKPSQFYYIMRHLTVRGYISKFIRRHVKNIQFNRQNFMNSVSSSSSEQLIDQFSILSCQLQCILHLQNYEKKKLSIHTDGLVAQEIVQSMTQAFFEIIQSENNLYYLLSSNQCQIFVEDLFSSHKQVYFRIIKKIFNPMFFSTARISENTISTIFDRLLIYSESEDGPHIVEIVNLFTKCCHLYESETQNHKRSWASLIMLCDKFTIVSKSLLYYITFCYLKHPRHLKQHELPVSLPKNRMIYKNICLLKCYELAVVIKVIGANNFTFKNLLVDNFVRRVDQIQENHKINDSFGLDHLIQKGRQVGDSIPKEKDQSSLTYYQNNDYFYISQEKRASLIKQANKIQKALQVEIIDQVLKQYEYPVNPRLNAGARLKSILWVVYYYKLLAGKNKKYEVMEQVIRDNSYIIQLLQKNAAFPGLMEAAFTFYYSNKHDTYTTQNTQTRWDNFIKKYAGMLDKIYQKVISDLRNNATNNQTSPEFVTNVEFLSQHIKANPSIYKDETNLGKQFTHSFILQRSAKYDKLRTKLIQQLKSIKDRTNLSIYGFLNHVDYPFVADYLIVCGSKSYAVFFVEAQNKEKYESLIRKSKQKKNEATKTQTGQQQQGSKQDLNMHYTKLCLKHFQEKSTPILMSGEEDIKQLKIIFDRMR